MQSSSLLRLQAGIQHLQVMQVLPNAWLAWRVHQGSCYEGEKHHSSAAHIHVC